MQSILLVDDEASLRELLEIVLTDAGYRVECATCGEDATATLATAEFDAVITDLKMARLGGLDVLDFAKSQWPNTQVIVMTAFSTTQTAIEAMKRGAYDYVAKPFEVDELLVVVEKALERRALSLEVEELKGALGRMWGSGLLVGRSPAMRGVFDVIERVAPSRASVLITGESGTGKELVAKAIHYKSPRQSRPFVVVNCGAIPENLMESELFGHVKGAFTGAVATKKGLFEVAHGGSVFLDEIGELPMPLQVKLLRVLQERRIKPVGATEEFDVDIRVVAATNKDLGAAVREGQFREDLYYRLNVIHLHLPPLRERREDIPPLVQHFVEQFARESGKPIRSVLPTTLEHLRRYRYPGNVRELENLIERAVTFEMTERLTPSSLPPHVLEPGRGALAWAEDFALPPEGMDLESTLADIETRLISQALARTGGVRTEAAKLLGISFRSIRYKLAKYGIDADDASGTAN